jgi:uncharacterized protein
MSSSSIIASPDNGEKKSIADIQLHIDEYVRDSTASFDSSHDASHAKAVYDHTIKIATETGTPYEEIILSAASKLHDVCDHKYPGSWGKPVLLAFLLKITSSPEAVDRIMRIIDNVSFSKQNSGKSEKLPEPDATYLTWIRDADRLEAIGKVGIDRCRAYSQSKNPNATEEEITKLVIQHCHEKLLRLYNEPGFIVTAAARRMAASLHEEIVQYVKENTIAA